MVRSSQSTRWLLDSPLDSNASVRDLAMPQQTVAQTVKDQWELQVSEAVVVAQNLVRERVVMQVEAGVLPIAEAVRKHVIQLVVGRLLVPRRDLGVPGCWKRVDDSRLQCQELSWLPSLRQPGLAMTLLA